VFAGLCIYFCIARHFISAIQDGGSMRFQKNPNFSVGYMPHGFRTLRFPSVIGLHTASDSPIVSSSLSSTLELVHASAEKSA
jgi:hypothetical protein